MTVSEPRRLREVGSSAPTLRDVAERAEVSTMTASRALRDDRGVSAATRERVLEAAAELGYLRNEAARNLRLGRSDGLIGLVVTNLANPFYSQLALGVEAAVAERGMRVMLGNSAEDPAREKQLVNDFASRRLDGLVVVPATNDHSHLAASRLRGMPVVLAARPPVKVDLDAVLLDDFAGTWEAVRHLTAAGHERIGFLGLPAASWTGSERYRGYCAALDEAGIQLDTTLSSHRQRDVETARLATLALLNTVDPPTAIFGANNRNTIGAYRALRETGRSVALAGFDDFELADLLEVPLTVVAYDPGELGRQAARLLCDRISDDSDAAPRRLLVPTRLVDYS